MEILVFGCSNGESIIIRIHDWICVVDSFVVDKKNPCYEYLKKNKITDVDLLVITHPHADHYDGVKDFTNLNVKKFILFNNSALVFQKALLKLWGESNDQAVKDWLEKERDKLKDLRTASDFFKDSCKSNYIVAARDAVGAFTIKEKVAGKDLTIRTLTPHAHLIDEPLERIARAAKNGELQLKTISKTDDQNIYSTTLEITYDDKSILLLADVDNKNISQLLDDNVLDVGYDVIKVSHHGSKNGNPPRLWEKIKLQTKPSLAIVTNHATHSLPEDAILKRIETAVTQNGGQLEVVPPSKTTQIALKVDISTSFPFSVTPVTIM